MHNVAHSLAHRAPPASRTRGRWQPYAAITSSSSSASSSSSSSTRNSPAPYLYTPTTSVSNSPPHKTPACDIDACRPQVFATNPSKDSLSRDGNRTKFALGLVDQSVKTLCDIWRPQDIPAVFNSPKPGLGVPDALSCKLQSQRLSNGCPASPILAHSLLATKSLPCIPTTPALLQTGTSEVRNYLIPIRGFVHEVLRRSRTSGGVLQTALCYLEAVRPKLHDLIREENLGIGMRGEPEPTSSVTPATDAELEMEAELSKSETDTVLMCTQPAEDMIDTVRIADDEVPSTDWSYSAPPQLLCETATPLKSPVPVSSLETPLLPSPLLCPRRTFLAALILASKFTQDKCYSNRAWAKLSGLPPREIGRCERALGNALEWRLWVGKTAAPAVPTAGQSTQTSKSVSRSQSEPSLTALNLGALPCMPRADHSTDAVISPPLPVHSQSIKSLRRSSTLPSEAFVPTKLSVDSMEVSDSWSSPFAGRIETSHSPLSDVPGLSYSPSSTESSLSSGERTIQMSTFLEDNMAPPTSDSTQSWPWLEADSNDIIDNTNSSPVAKIHGKLLSGNGLSGFHSKNSMLWNMTTSLGKPNEQLAAPPPHRLDHGIYDPSVALAIGNTESYPS